eukprot:TRINITY_DN4130_c0_g1_i4.p1 TRINITY_DN4130_c0_g1~~TRINITY_DN4130_c0_g1_i4.p1  ORF type:complete len:467 (-),score=54.60 TRINITY_DN4130_c0_g1_i4:135-1535(-)
MYPGGFYPRPQDNSLPSVRPPPRREPEPALGAAPSPTPFLGYPTSPPKPPVAPPQPAMGSMQITNDFLNIVKNGNLQEISMFISQYNLDVSKLVDNNFRHTCLFYAALIRDPNNSLSVMKFFIEKGVSAVYTDILNQTVLFYAAREGKVNCVDMLIKLGCKVNHRDQYGQTPLYYGAREGHVELVEKLLSYGADPNNVDANGQTALFYSAREGHKSMCELLVRKGANPNIQDKKRQTALHWARKQNKHEVYELLVALGGIPLKDSSSSKQRESSKAFSKKENVKAPKKAVDRTSPNLYTLTIFREGGWRKVTPAELEDFIRVNPTVAEYLKNPSLINSIQCPKVTPEAPIYDHWEKAAKKILVNVWKQPGAWHFHEPVNPELLHIPDYYNIIKFPMDLGTIKKKLANCAYASAKDFIHDVELVFSNCTKYNGEVSDFGLLAKRIREEFKRQCQYYAFDYYLSLIHI